MINLATDLSLSLSLPPSPTRLNISYFNLIWRGYPALSFTLSPSQTRSHISLMHISLPKHLSPSDAPGTVLLYRSLLFTSSHVIQSSKSSTHSPSASPVLWSVLLLAESPISCSIYLPPAAGMRILPTVVDDANSPRSQRSLTIVLCVGDSDYIDYSLLAEM